MKQAWILLAILLGCGLAAPAHATSLTNNEDVGDGILSALPDNVASNGNTFSWADKDGNGTTGDVVNAGLALGAYNLMRTGDGTGFVLDLNDGTSGGVIAWGGVSGGQITTARAVWGPTGPITIRGATDITCQGLYTHFTANGGAAGAIAVTQTGNFTATNVHTFSDYSGSGGDITFTGGGPAAGIFAVSARIDTHAQVHGAVTIRGYSGVNIGSGGIVNYKTADSSGRAVTITNIGPGGVTIGGNIQNWDTGGSSGGTVPNHVTIATAGSVLISGAETRTGAGGAWVVHDAGSIAIAAGGSVRVTGLLSTYMIGSGTAWSRNAGAVMVSATGSVQLGSLDTHNIQNDASRYAGDVTVTAGGDIMIKGTNIDMSSSYGGDRQGSMRLVTTAGSGKTITFGEVAYPGTNVLDLAKLEYIRFDSATGKSWIHNSITNFVPGSPNTKIRVERDGEVVYYAVKNGANAGLLEQNNGVYLIQSVAGGMGLLRPIAVRGTVVTFR